jgi:hypothetical protein
VQIAIEAVLKRNQLGLAQCSRDYLGTAIGEKARLSRTFSNRFGSVRLLHLFSRSPRPEIDRASPSPLPRNVKAKKCRGGWSSPARSPRFREIAPSAISPPRRRHVTLIRYVKKSVSRCWPIVSHSSRSILDFGSRFSSDLLERVTLERRLCII